MERADRDNYIIFYTQLLSSPENFVRADGQPFPPENVEELKKSLEDYANDFLARVGSNEPTEHEVTRLRYRYAAPRSQSPETTVLSDSFVDDVLMRLKEQLMIHWKVDVGPLNVGVCEDFFRLLFDTLCYLNYDLTESSASYWEVRDASAGELVHASGEVVNASKIALWKSVIEEGGDPTIVNEFLQLLRRIARYERNGGEPALDDVKWGAVTKIFERYVSVRKKRMRTRKIVMLLRISCKILSLHKRAVISANHPDKKKERGEFNI
jgi:hypothetical protein